MVVINYLTLLYWVRLFRGGCVLRDRTAKRAVKAELPLVIIADCPQVFPSALVESLERLEQFQRQALSAVDAIQVPPVGLACHVDSRFCHDNLAAEGLGLGVGLDDFAGHLVHEADLDQSGLFEPRAGALAGCGVPGAEVAELPIGRGVEIESPGEVGHCGARPAAISALAHIQKHIRQQRRIPLAIQSLRRFCDKMAALGQLGPARQAIGDQLGTPQPRAKPSRSARASAPPAPGRGPAAN